MLIREASVDSLHRRKGQSTQSARSLTLLYGAGDLGELFLKHLKVTSVDQLPDHQIFGFLDDRVNLKGKILDGFRVYGGLSELPHLLESGVDSIIVTASYLDPEREKELLALSEKSDLQIHRWSPDLSIHPLS